MNGVVDAVNHGMGVVKVRFGEQVTNKSLLVISFACCISEHIVDTTKRVFKGKTLHKQMQHDFFRQIGPSDESRASYFCTPLVAFMRETLSSHETASHGIPRTRGVIVLVPLCVLMLW